VGEFAFILSKTGIEYGLLSEQTNQYFLAVSIVSMFLTPFAILFAEKIAQGLMRINPVKSRRPGTTGGTAAQGSVVGEYENHLVIIGYGINGSNLARAAAYNNIPYLVIELNAETVQKEKKKNIPIFYGDATQELILESAHLSSARAVVIAISDPSATKAIIKNIRAVSQSVYLLVRTRYVKEMDELMALGADDVIPEEFETSVEIFSRVLHNFLVPVDDIEEFSEKVRADNYELFKSQKKLPKTFRPTQFPAFNITCMRVLADSSKILGKPLKELDLRNQYGVNILGITRNGDLLENIHSTEVILRDDVLFVSGSNPNIEQFRKIVS
jgi:CPA2 family monovalent cation:H+ antiporter-2